MIFQSQLSNVFKDLFEMFQSGHVTLIKNCKV